MIRVIQGKRVMLDSDLARLYGVTTAALNQAVQRNRSRFPSDFMIRLSPLEMKNWISQSVISNPGLRMGIRKPPTAFTEQGIAMLSSVLRSPRAVAANIGIMRAFVRYREALMLSADLADKFRRLEGKVDRHDKEIGGIMSAIRELIAPPPRQKRQIGFKPS